MNGPTKRISAPGISTWSTDFSSGGVVGFAARRWAERFFAFMASLFVRIFGMVVLPSCTVDPCIQSRGIARLAGDETVLKEATAVDENVLTDAMRSAVNA